MENNDIKTAQMAQLDSSKIVEIIIKYGCGVRGGKAVMKSIGIDCGICRLPINPMNVEEYQCLLNDLKKNDFSEM